MTKLNLINKELCKTTDNKLQHLLYTGIAVCCCLRGATCQHYIANAEKEITVFQV